MKKSTLLLFALITVFMLSGCEIYSLVKDLTDKEEGRITTTDGKVLTGRILTPIFSPWREKWHPMDLNTTNSDL